MMMFAEFATLPVFPLIQDSPPPISPAVLVVIAILLIILFIWLLLRERRARESAAAARAASAQRAVAQGAEARQAVKVEPAPVEPKPAVKPVEIPNQAMRVGPTIEPEAAPAAQPSAAAVVDDLEIIEGIGPKIAGVLKEAGVTSFAQLAAMDPSSISAILQAANLRLADPGTWPEQARLAATGDTVGLQALQDRLKGGRVV